MSRTRILPLATALLVFLFAAPSYAAGEVKLLRAEASNTLGRIPTEGLTFDILLKNLAYAKHVTVHLNNGAGAWTDLDGSYVRTVDGQSELWQASIRYYDPSSASATYTFSLKYEVAGMTFVDDNGGKNYTLQVNYDGLLLGTPVLLAAANTDPGSARVYGTIDVQNLAYSKNVTVFYTTDNWLTVQSARASYRATPPSSNAETWEFVLEGVTTLPVQYAIAYQTSGVTYWDNNYGQNYSLGAP